HCRCHRFLRFAHDVLTKSGAPASDSTQRCPQDWAVCRLPQLRQGRRLVEPLACIYRTCISQTPKAVSRPA
ncbi:MAG: hypothetical protein ABGY05_01085, partial [Pseudomonadota bacterium]